MKKLNLINIGIILISLLTFTSSSIGKNIAGDVSSTTRLVRIPSFQLIFQKLKSQQPLSSSQTDTAFDVFLDIATTLENQPTDTSSLEQLYGSIDEMPAEFQEFIQFLIHSPPETRENIVENLQKLDNWRKELKDIERFGG